MTLDASAPIIPAPRSNLPEQAQRKIVDDIISWSQSVTQAFQESTGIDLDTISIVNDAWDTRFLWLSTYMFIQTKLDVKGSELANLNLLNTYSQLVNYTLSTLNQFDFDNNFYATTLFFPDFFTRLYDYLVEAIAAKADIYSDEDRDLMLFAGWHNLKAVDLVSQQQILETNSDLTFEIGNQLGNEAQSIWLSFPTSIFAYALMPATEKVLFAKLIHEPLISLLIDYDTTQLDVEWISKNIDKTKRLDSTQKLLFAKEAELVDWVKEVLESDSEKVTSFLGISKNEYESITDDNASDELKIQVSDYCLKNLEITRYVYLVYDLVEVLCRTSEALFDSYKLHCLDYFYSHYYADVNTIMPELFKKLLDRSTD